MIIMYHINRIDFGRTRVTMNIFRGVSGWRVNDAFGARVYRMVHSARVNRMVHTAGVHRMPGSGLGMDQKSASMMPNDLM